MEHLQPDLLSDTLDQRIEEREALIRMLTWANEEISALGGRKTSDHITRAIECLRHEL